MEYLHKWLLDYMHSMSTFMRLMLHDRIIPFVHVQAWVYWLGLELETYSIVWRVPICHKTAWVGAPCHDSCACMGI